MDDGSASTAPPDAAIAALSTTVARNVGTMKTSRPARSGEFLCYFLLGKQKKVDPKRKEKVDPKHKTSIDN